MVNTLEIACLSSAAAAALAYLAYKIDEGQPTLPVEVDGEMVFVPKILFDILSDLRKCSIAYNDAISRIVKGAPLPDDEYAVVLQADRKWQVYVPFTQLVVFKGIRSIDTVHSVQSEFNALYKRVTTICAEGGEVGDDLLSYREQQKVKIQEVRVSRLPSDGSFRE